MTEKSITTSRVVDASAEAIFSVLSNPERHAEIDGSGMVQSDEKSDRITAVGQKFTMNQYWEKLGGDYKTDNYVVGYDHNSLLAWKTADAGTEPAGWQWIWKLEPQGPGSTEVTLAYDWSNVTDKEVLKRVQFPVVSEHDLKASLENLAAAVSES
ncbi:SRPBCC family protein [Arthrobacter tecti]